MEHHWITLKQETQILLALMDSNTTLEVYADGIHIFNITRDCSKRYIINDPDPTKSKPVVRKLLELEENVFSCGYEYVLVTRVKVN